MIEMTKLAVELFRRFDFELAEPTRDWTFDGNWLTTQEKTDVVVRPVSSGV